MGTKWLTSAAPHAFRECFATASEGRATHHEYPLHRTALTAYQCICWVELKLRILPGSDMDLWTRVF